MPGYSHSNVIENLRSLFQAGETGEALAELLRDLQPYDLSEILIGLDFSEQLLFLASLPPDTAASILEFLEPDKQYRLLDHLSEEVATDILNAMSSDSVVQFFTAIHPRQREQLFGVLREPYQEQIRNLMTYPENTVGSLASIDYLSARQWWSVEQTLSHIRKVGDRAEIITYIYVLGARGGLVGALSLRELIMAQPGTTLAEIMTGKVVSVPAEEDQEQAARLMAQYDLMALPVINDRGMMVGILTVDDVLDVIEEEATEDIHLLGGSQPLDSPYLNAGFFDLFRKRIVWLLVLFVAQAFTGNILRHYEGILTQVVALSFFIPLLIGTGGNAGSQTSTLVIRAMAVGEVSPQDIIKVIWREARLGLALGLVIAVLTFVRSMALESWVSLGLTVSATITAVVLFSSTIGAVMPMIGKRLGLDPAVFSTPMIATMVDAGGLIIYFQFARMMLNL